MNQIVDCMVNYFSFDEDAEGVPRRYFCYHVVAGPGPKPGSGVAAIATLASQTGGEPSEKCQAFHFSHVDGPKAAVARAIAYLTSIHQGERMRRVQSDLRRWTADAHQPLSASTDLKITARDVVALLQTGEPITILDVRSEDAWNASAEKARGAVRMRVWALPDAPPWPKDSLTVAYCTCPNDAGSVLTVRDLRDMGFHKSYAVDGGFPAWLAACGPVEAK